MGLDGSKRMAVQEAEAAVHKCLMMVPPNRRPSIVPLTQVRLAAGMPLLYREPREA